MFPYDSLQMSHGHIYERVYTRSIDGRGEGRWVQPERQRAAWTCRIRFHIQINYVTCTHYISKALFSTRRALHSVKTAYNLPDLHYSLPKELYVLPNKL